MRHRFRGQPDGKKQSRAETPSAGLGPTASATGGGDGTGRRYVLLAVIAIATGIGFNRLVTPAEPPDLSEEEQDIGLLYHKWSQPGYTEAIDTLLNWGQQPALYKTYPEAPQIDLPEVNLSPSGSKDESTSAASSKVAPRPAMDLVTTMLTRRSRRSYNQSFQRTRWKYHERTYRYVLTEVGHLGQNVYLAATALGLGVCCIGAFFDEPLNQLLAIDGEAEAALYLITVGI